MTNIEIGNRIKHARTIRNITLEDIAKKVGVAKSTIQRYENGKIENIKLPVIESIANALTVNPAWLIGKSDDMERTTNKAATIISYYNQLNDIGKLEAIKRVKELSCLSQYTTKEKSTYKRKLEGKPSQQKKQFSEKTLYQHILKQHHKPSQIKPSPLILGYSFLFNKK